MRLRQSIFGKDKISGVHIFYQTPNEHKLMEIISFFLFLSIKLSLHLNWRNFLILVEKLDVEELLQACTSEETLTNITHTQCATIHGSCKIPMPTHKCTYETIPQTQNIKLTLRAGLASG